MKPLLLIPILLVSCAKTEIVNECQLEVVDTIALKPRRDTITKHAPKPPRDTIERVPMGWNPTVEDWESADTTNIEI